ncbi:MAG: SBBP repeat-containing protein [Bacteroidota bacterium]|nr:SBBP repeat-containing protein [Bacteroidota bacterium]
MKKNRIPFKIITGLVLCAYVSTNAKEQLGAKSASNTISFTENKGQVYDQNYKPRPDVLFGSMTGNMAVHIKNNGVSYQLYKVNSYKEVVDEKTKVKHNEIDKQTIYRVDLNWVNANQNFVTTHDETLPGYNNYYFESCPNGALNVKSYTGITLNNLYNGINLHYYQKNGDLKHDYIVAPHSNYKQIQLNVQGATVSINKDGTLLLKTPFGKIQEGAPIVYQNGKQLKANWELKTNSTENTTLSFNIENYNSAQELIIDPVTRLWGTYYGANGDEFGNSCATDINGNVFMTGYSATLGGTIIATTGSHQSTSGGNTDAFLVKFNSNGVRQWGTYYGGAGYDEGKSCAADATSNIYLVGTTQSSVGTVIATNQHQGIFGGGTNDAFLVKFNSSGVRQWGTYYGGSGNDLGLSCHVYSTSDVYIAGTTASTGTVIATVGSHQAVNGGGTEDAFLAKFNSSGIRQWGTYYGGTGSDFGNSCKSDNSGNIYLTGSTTSNTGTVIATAGAHQSVHGVAYDAFLVKFNSNGIRQWGTYCGSNFNELSNSCATDASGNVYIAGKTVVSSGTVIATVGSHQFNFGGGSDAFLIKFNSAGVRQWGTYYGGADFEEGNACATDPSGNVYLAGVTQTISTGTVVATPGSYQSTSGSGTNDAFIVKFNTNGVRLVGTYYGGTGYNAGLGCATDGNGDIYLVGRTQTTTSVSIASNGAHQTNFGGGNNDAFLVKFSSNCTAPTNPTNTTPLTNQTICAGNFATLSATSGANAINWYATPTSTTLLGTGNSFATTTLAIGSYSYYAEASSCTVSATRTEITVNVQLCTGINELKNNPNQLIKVYPNPAHSIIYIDVENIDENTNVFVRNMLGQFVMNETINTKHVPLNIFDLPSGIYFIQLINNTNIVSTYKFVKE